MTITKSTVLAVAGVLALAILAPFAGAEPVGTAFTYQGVISDVDGPIDDTLDFRCSLWDDALAGIQFGPTQLIAATTVSGVFTLELDFGADPFEEPDAMWLQVEVSEDGGSNYSPLTRQRLMPSPYSLSTRGINVGADGTMGIGVDDPFLTPAMTISSDAKVGIGTQAPTSLLHIRDDAGPDTTSLLVYQTGSGSPSNIAIDGRTIGGIAVRGRAENTGGEVFGVYGLSMSATGWGVFSNGRFGATGTKSFVIDHPLDPANRMLLHYSSEAPEPLNTYSGTAYLDAMGQAVIMLPNYFESINTDFRYQLTAIGAAAPNLHVAQRIRNNAFAIAGGPAGLEVSWQVTATRNDAFVQQRGAPVEIDKAADQRGKYLMPELHGAPPSKQMHAEPTAADTSHQARDRYLDRTNR